MGRLLTGILGPGLCPAVVWEMIERARLSPGSVGAPRAFGAALTCLPAVQGPSGLMQYIESARQHAPHASQPATASFSLAAQGR